MGCLPAEDTGEVLLPTTRTEGSGKTAQNFVRYLRADALQD